MSSTYLIAIRTSERGSRLYARNAIRSLASSNAYEVGNIRSIHLFNTNCNIGHLEYIRNHHKECNISIPEKPCNGVENAIRTLRLASADRSSHLLFCEDDILFARGWLQYLDKWVEDYFLSSPVLATLYSAYPQVKMVYDNGEKFWVCPIDAFYGTQCVLLRNDDALKIADTMERYYRNPEEMNWAFKHPLHNISNLRYRGVELWFRECFYAMYGEQGRILAIAPSLVQHTGVMTGSGCSFHSSPSYMNEAPRYHLENTG